MEPGASELTDRRASATLCEVGGTDQSAGMAIELAGIPGAVASGSRGVVLFGLFCAPPTIVASLLLAGGVICATNVAPESTSGVRHVEQLAAPSGLLVLQWGQSMSAANFLSPKTQDSVRFSL